MLTLSELLADLKYDRSPNYRTKMIQFEPETAHLFRAAREIEGDGAEVNGIYVFRTSPGLNNNVLPSRPAVYIAKADNEQGARKIHRSLWNLGYAPFIIILLPNQLRVYTGFDYTPYKSNQRDLLNGGDESGLLETQLPHRSNLSEIINEFSSDSIDVGYIWQSNRYTGRFDPDNRVDKRLLKNLKELGKDLKGRGELSSETAHALIGKYVYIRYLWDRGILTEEWMRDQKVDKRSVLDREANVEGLLKLVKALEKRFNGRIFPFSSAEENSLRDDHVSLTASVLMGDALDVDASRTVQQLYLAFKAYDFRYIPVETLSAVYEQFIDDSKAKGAIYTPEILADYLLSEVHSIKPLTSEMKILDPACGSGIFLVLAYRRLIEQKLAYHPSGKLLPEELKELLGNIYGIEKERDACYVTEFSLILTLLHYIEPPELDKNDNFKFPALHNTHIIEGDFFNNHLEFWQENPKFDWIVGNPPWVPADEKQPNALTWILQNKSERPVGNLSVAEAFSWRVSDFSTSNGIIGLLLPATSLVNIKSTYYRKQFFEKHDVYRVTNFANLREVIFNKRSALPPATVIYRPKKDIENQQSTIHYGPFFVNQIASGYSRPWTITINENEIQEVPSFETISGKTSTWKYALWGTRQDERAIERIRHLMPTTLEEFCARKGWGKKLPQQGAELRDGTEQSEAKLKDILNPLEQLVHAKVFSTHLFNIEPRCRFSIPEGALIDNDKRFIREKGGEAGLRVNSAPHIIISKGWDFIIYSDEDFIIPPQQMGIAAPKKNGNDDCLRALSVYLSSSLVTYYLFFQVPEWGIFRQRESVVVSEVRKIPTPNLTTDQITELANLQKWLARQEKQDIMTYPNAISEVHERLQNLLDNAIYNLFEIPKDIVTLSNDFVRVRLPLDRGKESVYKVTRQPDKQDLEAYATILKNELDDFAMDEFYHKINIIESNDLIECIVELTQDKSKTQITAESIKEGDLTARRFLAEIRESIGEQFSQWVYVQRGLRLFEGSRIHIYKSPRLINWTRTQAFNDANDVIGQAISAGISSHEIHRA